MPGRGIITPDSQTKVSSAMHTLKNGGRWRMESNCCSDIDGDNDLEQAGRVPGCPVGIVKVS
jgi:hypothetical protein